jgi:lipopolysaccharide transport system ATP-binding protein
MALTTPDPLVVHYYDPQALTFIVVDPGEGDSARGNHSGEYPGVVRPILKWTTDGLPGANEPYEHSDAAIGG